ncbi:RagB/SusD family nutrient uptake outer membrane protein [Olivibacter domesticus]|uniref:Starch-binding associating with outer membrane n=1 Tax=Olivibacter domesticus TaxID=407022 RepID=A0A1H7HE04_OLID1|nr:RagB/SusD family nutrient uptake outer membrane protein [Olivibacter domesticus]SEK48519.1 Starch-binding associating with outer membrane [Olivibacter domesticus]
MNTINKIHLFVLAALAFTTTACKKDFLDVTPTDKVSDAAVLADSVLFEAFVVNRYLGVRIVNKENEGTPPGFGRGFEYAMWSSLSDESVYNNDDNTWFIQRGQLLPENTGIAGTLWKRSYRSIRECNYALTHINEVPMSDAHKNLIIAELKFIRAFRYHDLIRNYGGVVLIGDKVTELTDDFSDPSLFKREDIATSLAYVLAQLDEAAAVLPESNNGSWLRGRATKGAALALKSRLALYAASPLYNAGTWEAAVSAANAVITLNRYAISQSGYRQLFRKTSDDNEIIFARYYSVGARHVPLEIANGPNGYDGWGGNVPLQNLVDAYRMANGKAISDPTSGYDPQNPYVDRDPRFYQTILFNGASYRERNIETFTPGGRDSKDGPSNWNTSRTGYYLMKFTDEDMPINNPWNIAGLQPWIYFRYAEVLLNFAEAANELSGPDAVPAGASLSARDAINQIRTRTGVGMPAVPAGVGQQEFRELIRNERQIELAFEEHRFYDVRRWKIAEQTENVPAYGIDVIKSGNTLTYTRKVALDGRSFVAKHYWLPIPREEIQASNNTLQQNPGY